MSESLITIAKAAEILGVRRQSIHGMIQRGLLTPISISPDQGHTSRWPLLLERGQVDALATQKESTMKALSLTQPWASLVIEGAKGYETRSWGTTERGFIAIHAATGMPVAARDIAYQSPFREALGLPDTAYPDRRRVLDERLPRGALLGFARLDHVQQIAEGTAAYLGISEQERAFGDWTPGRYAWRFGATIQFEYPIPYHGALGLWTIDLAYLQEKVGTILDRLKQMNQNIPST